MLILALGFVFALLLYFGRRLRLHKARRLTNQGNAAQLAQTSASTGRERVPTRYSGIGELDY